MSRPKTRSTHLLGLLLIGSTPLTAAGQVPCEQRTCEPAALYWTTSCLAGCPDPAAFCAALHQDPGKKPSKNTGYCGGQACLADQAGLVKYGFLDPVVAQGAVGQYPRIWNVTLTEDAQLTFAAGCDLWILGTKPEKPVKDPATTKLKKGMTLRVKLPSAPLADPKCYFDLVPLQGGQPTDAVYHEHFAAYEGTRCLGWLECTHSTASPPPTP